MESVGPADLIKDRPEGAAAGGSIIGKRRRIVEQRSSSAWASDLIGRHLAMLV
jgi:hypothetical protein